MPLSDILMLKDEFETMESGLQFFKQLKNMPNLTEYQNYFISITIIKYENAIENILKKALDNITNLENKYKIEKE